MNLKQNETWDYGKNKKGIWKKEEMWINPTVLYNNFARYFKNTVRIAWNQLYRTYGSFEYK